MRFRFFRRSLSPLGVAAAALALSHSARAVVCTPGLQSPTYQSQPARPRMTILTDMNQDGIPDLVVTYPETASGFAGSVGVMLGNGSAGVGDGTFQPPVTFATGSRPWRLAVADFDGDGRPDLVTANWASNSVTFLHGVGDGTFSGRVDFPAGVNPFGLTVGDFNHDGALDLAVSDNGAKTVAILIGGVTAGHGNGTFQPFVSYGILDLSTSIIAADLDHDGNLDLVATSNYSGRVSVLKGVANGTFVSGGDWAAGAEPYALVAADLNGDGNLDLAVSSGNHGGVNVLRGTGTGAFMSPVSYAYGLNCGDIVTLDLDGDGITDLAFPNTDGNQVLTMRGIGAGGVGDGTFSPTTAVPVSNFPVGVIAADITHDGRPDLIVSAYLSQQLAFLRSACTVAPPPPGQPLITAVRDAPHDQGGKVFVTWTSSSFDVPSGAVTTYRVWRRIPAAGAQSAALRLARGESGMRATRIANPDGSQTIVYWEAAAVLPAQRLPGYGYTSATPQDSLAGSNPYTAFFITAATANPDVFYDSPVDSGYSVDNLAPAPPAAFAAQYGAGQVKLHWPANSEPDLAGYRLYRGTSQTFTAGAGNLVHAANDTAYTDITSGSYFYKLAAIDIHGNLSPFLLVSPSSPTASEISLVTALYADGAARLDWFVDASVVPVAEVQRLDGTGWTTLSTRAPDGVGHLVYADGAIRPGAATQYRLQWSAGGILRHGGEAVVTAPGLRLAFRGAQPNPATGREGALVFTLPHDGPATLAVFDMAGRRVTSRDVGALGSGDQRVLLSDLRLPAGVYLARLAQGAGSASGRFVVVQ